MERAGAAAAQQAQERARVLAEVRAASLDGVMAQAREALAEAGHEMAARALEAARKRVLAGKSSPLDETRARVDLAQAALAVKEAQAHARSARLKLATWMGEEGSPSFGRLQDAWPASDRPAWPELATRLEGSPWLAVEAAQVARHEVLAATEAQRQRPAWTVSLGRKQEGGSSQPLLGVSVPLLILDRQEGAREAATQRLSQARERLRETRLRLLASLQDARARLDSAQASLSALRDEVLPAAEQALSAASQGFEAGKCSFLEVLEARRALLDARQRQLDSQGAALTAAHDIDRLTGDPSGPITGPIAGPSEAPAIAPINGSIDGPTHGR
jgi:cobalt-zinc-cadmium efflux system outer membrane protein